MKSLLLSLKTYYIEATSALLALYHIFIASLPEVILILTVVSLLVRIYVDAKGYLERKRHHEQQDNQKEEGKE